MSDPKALDYHISDNGAFQDTIPTPQSSGMTGIKIFPREANQGYQGLPSRAGEKTSWRDNIALDIASAVPGYGDAIDVARSLSALFDGEFAESAMYAASAFLPASLSLFYGAKKAGKPLGKYAGEFLNSRIYENTPNTITGFYSGDIVKKAMGTGEAVMTSAKDYMVERMNPKLMALRDEFGLNYGNTRRLREYTTQYDKLMASAVDGKVTPQVNVQMRKLAKQIDGELESVFASRVKFGREVPKPLQEWAETFSRKVDGTPTSYFGKTEGLVDPVFYDMNKLQTHRHASAMFRDDRARDLIHYAKMNVDEKTLAKAIPGAKIENGKYILEFSPDARPNFFIGGFNGKMIVDPKAAKGAKNVQFLINDEFDVGSGMIKKLSDIGTEHSFVTVGESNWALKYLDEPSIKRSTDAIPGPRAPRKKKLTLDEVSLNQEIETALEAEGEKLVNTYMHAPVAERAKTLLDAYETRKANIGLNEMKAEIGASAMFLGYRGLPLAARAIVSDQTQVTQPTLLQPHLQGNQ